LNRIDERSIAFRRRARAAEIDRVARLNDPARGRACDRESGIAVSILLAQLPDLSRRTRQAAVEQPRAAHARVAIALGQEHRARFRELEAAARAMPSSPARPAAR
jgi:hypothetical protein